jgi:hypothetical protein
MMIRHKARQNHKGRHDLPELPAHGMVREIKIGEHKTDLIQKNAIRIE